MTDARQYLRNGPMDLDCLLPGAAVLAPGWRGPEVWA